MNSALSLPIIGRTYSLYGGTGSTTPYYQHIARIVDAAAAEMPNLHKLLALVQRSSRRYSGSVAMRKLPESLKRSLPELKTYLTGVKKHLRELSIFKLRERSLWTTERQYLLYMVEIELINRLQRTSFAACERKIALLPHCIRDFSRTCRAESDGVDLLCKGCSKLCHLRPLSDLLQERDVTPYIWMEADFKDFYTKLGGRDKPLGILGVACIPELVPGLRRCLKAGIPAQGLPLDANRCIRWMGDFLENSVNLEILGGMI